jgi:hypothetical protein
MSAGAHHPTVAVPKCHGSERSFGSRFGGPSCRGTIARLLRGDLGMMGTTQHLESTFAIFIGAKMVMTAGPVSAAVARLAMIDLAVASCGIATRTRASVLRAAFGRSARESPDVFALPCPPAGIRTPGAPTCARDGRVAPLATPGLTLPCRQRAGDAFGNEWWERHDSECSAVAINWC